MQWKKASNCETGACVEVGTNWVKSTKSSTGNCVEVKRPHETIVYVRNSNGIDGLTLRFTADEWRAFILGAKAGEFDID